MRIATNLIPLLCLSLLFLMTGCVSTQVSNITHKHLKFGNKKNLVTQAKQAAAKEAAAANKVKLPTQQDIQVPIGTVHMVDHVGKFILIKSSRTTALEPETQIIAYGPNAQMSSHLKASPARKGAYLTADLVEGTPSVGDMVMIVKSIGNKPLSGAALTDGTNVQVLE